MEPEDIEAFNARVRRRNARLATQQHAKPPEPTVQRREPGKSRRFLGRLLGFGVGGGLLVATGIFVNSQLSPDQNWITAPTPDIRTFDQTTGDTSTGGATQELVDAGNGAVEVIGTIGRTLEMLQSPHETFTPYIPRQEPQAADTKGMVSLRQGRAFGSEVVLSAAAETVPFSAFSEHASALPPRFATKVTMFEANGTCEFRGPSESETVVGVRIERARGPIVAYSFSDQERLDRLRQMILIGLSQGTDSKKFRHGQRVIRAVDVYVTDMSGPLYLVLQSSGNIAWRLHIADGVKVAHVALVGDRTAALLAPPKGISFEAVLAREFMRGYRATRQDKTSAKPAHCTARPDRKPAPSWTAYAGANRGVSIDRNLVSTYEVSHAAYATWYKGAFDRDAADNTLAAYAADHVLIGPPPTSDTKFQTGRADTLVITKAENVVVGDPETRTAEMYARHHAVIAAAAGGDLANLNPPPMTREGQ